MVHRRKLTRPSLSGGGGGGGGGGGSAGGGGGGSIRGRGRVVVAHVLVLVLTTVCVVSNSFSKKQCRDVLWRRNKRRSMFVSHAPIMSEL